MPSRTTYLNIIPNDTTVVTVDPQEIFTGDTAAFDLKNSKEALGWGLVQYPPWARFNVGIMSGFQYGSLVSADGSQSGTDLFDVPAGFKFIAADEIDEDSVVVALWIRPVSTYSGYGPPAKVTPTPSGEHPGHTPHLANKSIFPKIADYHSNVIQGDNGRPVGFPELSTKLNGIPIRTSSKRNGYDIHPKITSTIYAENAWIVIRKTVSDHLELQIIPDTLAVKDTLAFTERARLIVIAKDAFDQEVPLDDDTLLKFTIETNDQYGTFVRVNGDTVKTTPPVLDSVRYADARAGRPRFAAVKLNPDSVEHCLLRVIQKSDPTMRGEREAVVLEKTLIIVMTAPYEVHPVIPPATVINPGPQSRKPFQVQLTRDGKPVSEHPFRLSTDYLDGSGGHDHLTPRRERVGDTQTFSNFGQFQLRDSTRRANPYDGQTPDSGKVPFIYMASVFGDTMKVRLNSLENRLLLDSVNVVERVPGLVELLPGTHYELVGAPNNHSATNDPCRTVPPVSLHYDNHFGTNTLIVAIQSIANAYYLLNPGIKIRVNDMSLLYGGLFDGPGNHWRIGRYEGHSEHRRGLNADLGYWGINQNEICINLNRQRLLNIIADHTDGPTVQHDDHYHIRMH